MSFKRGLYRIVSDNEEDTTMLEIKRDGEAGWTKCFEYPKSIDYTVHTYISAGGANPKRRGVYINSIKFYDNEEVIEGENEQLEEFSH